MRPIKFRGYNEKNGLWLYGSYILNRGAHFVCPDEFANGKTWEDYEVVPESVGQCLGVKDSQGNEIYEGDIVEVFISRLFCDGKVIERRSQYKVFYDTMFAEFKFDCIKDSLNIGGMETAGMLFGVDSSKVVGNSYGT